MNKDLPLTEGVFYILLALIKPNHGYGIIQDVEQMTSGRLVLGAGTLYGAINTMLDKGWIKLYSEEVTSRKKKEYMITTTGKEILKFETERLEELIRNSKIVMEDRI
ncbi:MAG: helix-turn-helix transcriptional regulator [Bacillota bacterium]|nr:helix-turn-helix transcriptional regulator [Bacillota bacterium]